MCMRYCFAVVRYDFAISTRLTVPCVPFLFCLLQSLLFYSLIRLYVNGKSVSTLVKRLLPHTHSFALWKNVASLDKLFSYLHTLINDDYHNGAYMCIHKAKPVSLQQKNHKHHHQYCLHRPTDKRDGEYRVHRKLSSRSSSMF